MRIQRRRPLLTIQWRKQRRQKDKERKDNRNTGKKARGKKGHMGVSRKHDPEKTEHYKFEYRRVDGKIKRVLTTCTRGSDMVRANPRVRDMLEIEIMANEIRDDIETAKCPCYNDTVKAPNNLPKKGSYGRTLVGLIAELRAARIPLDRIPEIINHISDTDTSTSTVSNVVARIGDSVVDKAAEITKAVEKSPPCRV